MNEKFKEKFPEWCFDNKKYSTVLTNDIDSLLGCAIEKHATGNKINYFYDFNSIFVADKELNYPSLSIDLALTKGKCWDNHVTRLNSCSKVNSQSANVNSILNVSGDNYYEKYCMSTAILMWSFYGLPLPETKKGKMLLLAIDSGFLGHYNPRYRQIHNKYLKLLGFEELIDLLNETTTEDFKSIQQDYKLYAHIELNKEGYLETELPVDELSKIFGLSLELPGDQFSIRKQYKSKGKQVNGDESGILNKNVISFALTGKRYYKYTHK